MCANWLAMGSLLGDGNGRVTSANQETTFFRLSHEGLAWTLPLGLRSVFLVNAHVVDLQRLGEGRRRVGGARPLAADGDVDQEKEGVLELPGVAARDLRSLGLVERAVDVEANGPRLPLEREHVKAVRVRRAVRQLVGAGGAVALGHVQASVV